MTVAENIKRLRKEKGFTQKQLAEKCGMAESTLRQYEIGYRNPKLETLHKIANALDISIILLVEGCENKYPLSGKDFQLDLYNSMMNAEKILDELEAQKATRMSNTEDIHLLNDFRKLNNFGKKEARKRVQELTEIKRYTEKEEPPAE